MRHNYNPFTKPFAELKTSDLGALRSVAEGWYIEYKREMSSAATVAKSISSFANTYGGWIFYGIAEKSKDEPVAGEYTGLPRAEADAALQRIRQSIAANVQPSPHFEAKALHGPDLGINLADDRSIIVVWVPWGADAPYIHNDGRIYRRIADGSEPRPESDRFIVDKLASRSKKLEEFYDEWVGRELETVQGEEDSAYLRIFLIADFWKEHTELKKLPIKTIRRIMRGSSEDFDVPINSVFPAAGATICRQPYTKNPESLGLTWTLYHDFRSEITIPLNKIQAGNLLKLQSEFAGYENIDRFIDLCRDQNFKNPNVVDLNLLLVLLIGLVRKHAALATEIGWEGPMLAKIRISGVGRTVPFFDTTHVLDEYKEHGIAINLTGKLIIPDGIGRSSFFNLPPDKSKENSIFPQFLMALTIFSRIATSMGAAVIVGDESDTEAFTKPIVDFFMAGQRAIAAQKQRQNQLEAE